MKQQIAQHEQRLECLINYHHYRKCKTKFGTRCRHLGGDKIPKWKTLKKAV